ncbi:MAG TPA: Rrf2 family transcriptional regulator [Polyangia bacterium]|jgi:Rrf2 family nitric oxide-sensitive transcriptional repressor|nr:Rrf2 family transcriptional regulator [Polyangia bacterium]
MQLTQYTDYAIRTLLYLGAHREEVVPVTAIAEAYGISAHHLAKVAQMLTREGFVRAQRGKKGGLQLAREPELIAIGEVVRRTEPNFHLVECFDAAHNSCPISGACRLQHVLEDARRAFLKVLDGVTLGELLGNQQQLVQLLGRAEATRDPPA